MKGFIRCGYALSGPGAGRRLGTEADILEILRDRDLGWLHLDADDPDTRPWAEQNLDFIDPNALSALLAETTRPRIATRDGGVLVILRAINAGAGAAAEDMVSIRLWVDPARIVSLSRREIVELDEIAEEVGRGEGPQTAGAFLAALAGRLNDRIEDLLSEISAEVDTVEDAVSDAASASIRSRVTATRQRLIAFRRHIAPQRDAVDRLMLSRAAVLSEADVHALIESYDRLTRLIEEADTLRDRLSVARDELQSALSERLNRNLYLLSVITVIFLPLGFLTGLMGINVAGLPGAETPAAFWIFVAILVAVLAAQLLWLRWRRWF
jgi:zinc transporter